MAITPKQAAVFWRADEAHFVRVGAIIAPIGIRRLERATIDRCEAVDLVPTADDAVNVRCTNIGVRIRETDAFGLTRHRTVCPKHGYDPKYTPPLHPEEL